MRRITKRISLLRPVLAGVFVAASLIPIIPLTFPVAQAASAFPQVGIQLSDVPSDANSVVSAGCWVDNNGNPELTPVGGGASAGAGDSNFFEEKCGQIYLSSSGTFTQDFQIGLRLGASAGGKSCDPSVMTGASNYSYGPWSYTPWASQAGSSGGWSLWTSDNLGFDVDCYQLVVNTRPLPFGSTLSNVKVGLQFKNGNGGGLSQPNNCNQSGGQIGWPVYTTGGWSENNPNQGASGVAGTNGPGWTPGYDTTDCAQVFLSADMLNGAPDGDNIPPGFNTNETKTVGTDGINQPSVAMKNTGGVTWYTYSQAADPALGPTTGTCDSTYGSYPAPNPLTDPLWSSCTSWWAFSSGGSSWSISLQHAGSFGTNPTPIYFQVPVQVTVTVQPGGVICVDGFGCFPLPPSDAATYSNSTAVGPGSTATFPMSSMTAPGANGNYNETWQLTDDPFGTPFTKTISVGVPPPTTGTITVSSTVGATTVNQVMQSAIGQVPYSSLLYSNGDKNGALYCPAGTIMSGIQSLGYDNYGTVIAGQPMCSTLTADAATEGLALSGTPTQIDSSSNGGTLMCPAGMVVDGVEWAKNNQIDFGECETLLSNGNLTLGNPVLITANNTNTNYYCPPGSLIVGGQNAPQKNDSWNGFYCAPITYSKTTITGGYLVPASWNFSQYPTGSDPCTFGTCTGTQQTYPSESTGPYTINPISAGPLYALAPNKAAPIAARAAPSPSDANPLISFVKNIFTSVANAFGFPPTNPQTQSLPAGGLANFVILWDPIAQLSVSTNPNPLDLTQASPSGVITVSNPGAVGSALNWTDTVSYGAGPSGWLSLSPAGSVLGGSSENITAIADVASIPPGSCTVSPYCAATVTFTGTSEPNPPGGPALGSPAPPITITLIMGSAKPSIVIGPPATVAACVPVTTTCSGGNGTYAWSADPGVSINGAGGSVQISSCSPGNYAITCTSAGQSSSTQLTVVPGCTLSASPSAVVPPQTAKLTWSCQPDTVTSCTIAGGSQNWTVCNSAASCNANSGSSVSASPSATTLYQLTCQASTDLASPYYLTAPATVSVQAPGRVETSSLGVP